jgi:hypothetical protein
MPAGTSSTSAFHPRTTSRSAGACDSSINLFCSGTLACFGGRCARYCCTDADCGASGTCDTSYFGDSVGLCVAK